ncbi:MAG TPA: hypothetical protein VFQ40_08905 [Actinomycetota bacterium]|nr:hypothetical protein [Actinomycetota bacterium]
MKKLAVVGGVAIAVIGVWLSLRLALFEEDPYASLRQRSAQAIPGALGYALEPPPAGSRPELSPEEARTRYPAGGAEVAVSFASVRDTLEDRAIGPGWVLVARGVCLRNSKGELVSDARGTDPLDLECTDDTVWILAVDAETGDPLVALTGYDPDGTFRPDVGSGS